MSFYGHIRCSPNVPAIDEAAWLEFVDQHPSLSRVEPRSGKNPFTGEVTVFNPDRGTAVASIDGKKIGVFRRLSDSAISVQGEDPRARDLAREIAARVNGTFLEDDPSR